MFFHDDVPGKSTDADILEAFKHAKGIESASITSKGTTNTSRFRRIYLRLNEGDYQRFQQDKSVTIGGCRLDTWKESTDQDNLPDGEMMHDCNNLVEDEKVNDCNLPIDKMDDNITAPEEKIDDQNILPDEKMDTAPVESQDDNDMIVDRRSYSPEPERQQESLNEGDNKKEDIPESCEMKKRLVDDKSKDNDRWKEKYTKNGSSESLKSYLDTKAQDTYNWVRIGM